MFPTLTSPTSSCLIPDSFITPSRAAFKRSSGNMSLKPPFFARQMGVRNALMITTSSGLLVPMAPIAGALAVATDGCAQRADDHHVIRTLGANGTHRWRAGCWLGREKSCINLPGDPLNTLRHG